MKSGCQCMSGTHPPYSLPAGVCKLRSINSFTGNRAVAGPDNEDSHVQLRAAEMDKAGKPAYIGPHDATAQSVQGRRIPPRASQVDNGRRQAHRTYTDSRDADLSGDWRRSTSAGGRRRRRSSRPIPPGTSMQYNNSQLVRVVYPDSEAPGRPAQKRESATLVRKGRVSRPAPKSYTPAQRGRSQPNKSPPRAIAAKPSLASISLNSIIDCPQYYLIGAQKCGTSTIHRLLNQRYALSVACNACNHPPLWLHFPAWS